MSVPEFPPSLLGEAVEQAGAAGCDEVGLAAAARGVREIPRRGIIPAALTVVVADVSASGSIRIARPVAAVGGSHRKSAVQVRSGQDVVRVWIVAASVDGASLFGQRVLLGEFVLIAVQHVDILRHDDALHVLPWTTADAITCVNSRLIAAGGGAEVCAPRFAGGARCGREFLAVRIGSGEPSQVGPIARASTGDEEAQVGSGCLPRQ